MSPLMKECRPLWLERDARQHPCYRGGPPKGPNSYVGSLMCQGRSTFQHHLANFAADVQVPVQLNASFAPFATGIRGWPDQFEFIAGSYFLTAAGRTVFRINAAYAGLGTGKHQ